MIGPVLATELKYFLADYLPRQQNASRHETRQRLRINAVKSRIMIVPSIFRPTGSEGHVERAVRDELRVSRRSYSAR